jgi:hypothetical protein
VLLLSPLPGYHLGRRWLTTVAIELRNTNTRDWRLARHILTTRQIRLVSGLGAVLAVWLLGWSMFRDRDAPAHTDFRLRGRVTALDVKLVLGLVGGDRDAPDTPTSGYVIL